MVSRRKVFFIPGFDPHPVRRYRELFRSQMQRQAEISGHEMSFRAVPGQTGRWRAFCSDDQTTCLTEFEVLDWSDVVAGSFSSGTLAPYRKLVLVLKAYLSAPGILRLLYRNRGPALVALYPVATVLLQGALLMALGLSVLLSMMGAIPMPVALSGALLSAWMGAQVFARLDRWLFAQYLLHDYAFFARHGGRCPAELERRLDDFASQLHGAVADGYDEVLVVGHSTGAALAVSLVARVQPRSKVSLMTLGQSVPMLTVLPDAKELRLDVRDVSVDPDLFWLDVGAPGDPCCFFQSDMGSAESPLRVSAAFSRTVDAERWRKMRWQFFRRHSQYLCAFDHPLDYDYFEVTCGARTLRERYAGRGHSPAFAARALKRAA